MKTVAVVSTGDMGHAVGRSLRERGLRVMTCLTGRSDRTRGLAQAAGIEDVPALEDLVAQADVFLSIVPPSEALTLAGQVARALKATGSRVIYVDCNAVSPQTARQIGEAVLAAGGRYVDGGIIGPPPARAGTTRVYISGPDAGEVLQLNGGDVEFISIGDRIDAASAMKMCYAAISKGTAAIWFESLIAAQALGVTDELWKELSRSQAGSLPRIEQQIPGIPPKAKRWVGEMDEIAATFAAVGLTPHIFEGAAEIWRFVGDSPLGEETPESVDRGRKVLAIMAELRECLGATSKT